MEYRIANIEELDMIYDIVQEAICTIYPRYYPKEVVEFFSQLHNKQNIEKDLLTGHVGVLIDHDEIVGTGCYDENHITRVYVRPKYQKKGYGTYIMDCLEKIISLNNHQACLDASLPASHMYEKRGYQTKEHGKHMLEHDVVLVYEVMEKKLCSNEDHICYEGRTFIPKSNSEHGEVSEQTLFHYHQEGDCLYGEYRGGEILRGYLIGSVHQDGTLDFYYEHKNIKGELKVGTCHSEPHMDENGILELHEQWQWLHPDTTKGTSILKEVIYR